MPYNWLIVSKVGICEGNCHIMEHRIFPRLYFLILSSPSKLFTKNYQIKLFKYKLNITIFQTYCIDAQVPDSACTATSYLTGVKTKYGVIGLDGNVTRGACHPQLHEKNWASSIGQWALDSGLDVGKLNKKSLFNKLTFLKFLHTGIQTKDDRLRI